MLVEVPAWVVSPCAIKVLTQQNENRIKLLLSICVWKKDSASLISAIKSFWILESSMGKVKNSVMVLAFVLACIRND